MGPPRGRSAASRPGGGPGPGGRRPREQTAYDLDFIRALAGEDTLDYYGASYGTWLGSWYQRLFPHHSGRFVFDSAADLTRTTLQNTWDLQPPSRDRQFQESLLPYVARKTAVFGASSDDPLEAAVGVPSRVGSCPLWITPDHRTLPASVEPHHAKAGETPP